MNLMKHALLSLFLLILLPSCEQQQNRIAQEKSFKEIEDSVSALKEGLNQKISEGGITETGDLEEDYLESIDKIKENAPEEMQKMLSISQQYLKKCMADSKEFEKMMPNLEKGVTYTDVKEPVDLDRKSELIKEYREANTTLKEKINRQWKGYARASVRDSDLSPAEKSDLLKELLKAIDKQLPHLNTIRNADTELCATILKQHKLLKENFQHWGLDPETENLNFTSDELVDAYNALAEEIQRIADKQLEAQKKLVAAQ